MKHKIDTIKHKNGIDIFIDDSCFAWVNQHESGDVYMTIFNKKLASISIYAE